MDTNVYFDERRLKQHYATTGDFRSRSEDWERLAKRPITKWYVEQLGDLDFQTVLDVGSGLGRFSEAIARAREVDITAIDLAQEMVAETQRSLAPLPGRHRFVHATLESAPFEDEAFDLTMANLLLHHVPDISVAFGKLSKLTKANGHIAVLTASFDWMSELNRLQDEALLRLGIPYDHPSLTAPGTNRFCSANILQFAPADTSLVRRSFFDGTMTFPSEDAIHDFYIRTMRYKNVAGWLGNDTLREAAKMVIRERFSRAGGLTVSSDLYLYIFRKA